MQMAQLYRTANYQKAPRSVEPHGASRQYVWR
jgi:hypothetical protein